MIKLRLKRFSRSSSKISNGKKASPQEDKDCSEIKWELRPGGMLVQKREKNNLGEGMITIRVSTMSQWHDISIENTSTFGELKKILSLITRLEPREQRLLFKGKERDDNDFLHMIGVKDKDKVLLLEDPAIKEKKLLSMLRDQPINNSCTTRATPCW
ncbi:hypothetical protein TanjilG_01588 [Lupinus angustifolius]|uniref:BAG family molecular chaperone regulator 2-like n=1 Tax=Lupinus angustifolius TaxID=3871 RepID=UPI00090E13B9|nr:PREDICTED: BAG family molecular chaperone regulator 2-like [Lupinus angustifolius]OIV90134.1 hypothetical protein TanjilG_01588 [Lupinus angustifolius]